MASFFVDHRGQLARRNGQTRFVPSGRIHFGTRNATWLEPFSGVGRELVLVASAVRQVDRLVRRKDSSGDDRWGRKLELSIPVRNVETWNRAKRELEALLHWLTDDAWTFRFVRSDEALPVQQHLFDEHPIANAQAIALFSGGLDSVAGADVWLRRGVPTYLLCVSGDNVHAKHATASARVLIESHPGRAALLAATLQLRRASVFERSQRSRGFFFFAIAAAAANALRVRRLVTFEAGAGALNLPMNAAQTGAENTHAMHPRTLLLLRSLFTRLFDSDYSVEAPFLFMTKGELCKAVGRRLRQLAAASYSCDSPQSRRAKPFQHCGVCTSCLYRRSALLAASRTDPTDYRIDLLGSGRSYEREAFREQGRQFCKWTTLEQVIDWSPNARYALEFAKVSAEHTGVGGPALVRLLNRHGEEVAAMFTRLARNDRFSRSGRVQEVAHAIR